MIFLPSHASKGANNCNLSEVSETATTTPLPSAAGAWKPLSSTANPLFGNSSPFGGSNFTASPLSFNNVSVIGLKDKSPEIARAATISGEVTKACVFGFPSARFEKFLLNECTIVFFSPLSAPSLSHCPIHGPQAFVNTLVPIFSNVAMIPSLSIVYLICSEPVLIPNSAFGEIP